MKKFLWLLACFMSVAALTNLWGSNEIYAGMDSISKLSNAKSRSISPENFTGEVGGGAKADPSEKIRNVSNAADKASNYGKGWKVNPFIVVLPNETFTIADIKGCGAIQQMWMTPAGDWRSVILRIYWDGEENPSVECPIGDFFCSGFGQCSQLSSLAVCLNPGSAFNCYWKMPFRKSAKITIQNLSGKDFRLYYQINYALGHVDENEAYFHAQFRRSNPTSGDLHTILDGVVGKGQYVGTYFAWLTTCRGWWGEGEVKFYMDSDSEYPTVCGTGLEDYICGSYNFDKGGKYTVFTTPYSGLHELILPPHANGKAYAENTKFGMYRWHIADPIRFESKLKVTVQDLGWGKDGKYAKQTSDIATVAYWYQTEPHAKFPQLPSVEALKNN